MRPMLVAVLLLAVLGALFWLLPRERTPRDSEASAPAAASASPSSLPDAALAPSEAPQARAEPSEAAATKAQVEDDPKQLAAAPPVLLVGGRIVDLLGQPLAAASVGFKNRSDLEPAVSDADGRFELAAPADLKEHPAMLTTRGNEHVALAESIVDEGTLDHEHLIVAAHGIRLEGRVIDRSGVALADARVEIPVEGRLTRFPLPLERAQRREFAAETDAQGRFALMRAPAFPGGVLAAFKVGYERAEIELPAAPAEDLVLVLEQVAERRTIVVEGVVLLPDRSPAPSASVRLGELMETTDGAGRFSFEIELGENLAFEGGEPLAAALRGYGPAILEGYGAFLKGPSPSSPPPAELVLAPDLRLAGVVLDSAGAPAKGWHVSLLDGYELSRLTIPATTLENLSTGPGNEVITRADGRFEIGGLTPRSYTLQAFDPKSLVRIEHGGVPAGSMDVVLRAPADALLPRVAGRVITRAGRPVPKAQVRLSLASVRTKFGYSSESGASVWTDDEGRFELKDVPRDSGGRIYLAIDGDDILPETYWFDDEQPVESLVLSVAARCRYRVENDVADEELAGSLWLSLLDEKGESLMLYELEGRGWSAMLTQKLVPGSNGIRSVSEDARTLRVVVRPGNEVFLERPISLTPEIVTPIALP